MGHVALQRVVVRMLFDEAFADRVYADPAGALAGLALTPAERGGLVAPDRRAYGVDPLRRHRALQALLEEHPVSAAALAAGGFAVREHDRFFSGARFHGAIQGRRSLATAFGEHLAELARTPLQRGVVALERALAEARRGVPAAWAPGVELRLCAMVRVVACPAGSLAAYGAIHAALGPDGRSPLATLLAGPVRLPRTPVDPVRGEQVLITDASGAGAALSFASDELATLLDAARPGATRAALVTVLGELGLAPHEASELLEELVTDGLIEDRPAP